MHLAKRLKKVLFCLSAVIFSCITVFSATSQDAYAATTQNFSLNWYENGNWLEGVSEWTYDSVGIPGGRSKDFVWLKKISTDSNGNVTFQVYAGSWNNMKQYGFTWGSAYHISCNGSNFTVNPNTSQTWNAYDGTSGVWYNSASGSLTLEQGKSYTMRFYVLNIDGQTASEAYLTINVPVYYSDHTLTVNPAGGTWGYTSQPSTDDVVVSNNSLTMTASNITSDGYDITVRFNNASGITKVEIPTWSDKNSQDDIVWYQASVSGNTATLHIDVSKHKYDMGAYLSHLYVTRNGNRTCDATMSIPVPTTPYGSNYFPAPSTATRTFALRNYETKDIPVPTREGYEFTGWTLTGTPATWETDLAGTGPGKITMGKMNVTLTATWKQSKYTVHYDGNGATSGSMSDQSATYGQTFNLSKNQFSKSNYTFQGWNTKADGSGTSYRDQQSVTNLTSPGKTITLYAQWKPMNYTIIYKGNGNTGGSMSNQVVAYDSTVNLKKNAFTKSNYTFQGWNTRADGSGTSYRDQQSVKNLAQGGGTITLYAQWKPMNYTIVYNGNGATRGSMSDQVVAYDSTVNLKKNTYQKANYTFQGWNTRSDGKGTSYSDQQQVKNLTNGGGTITLYAQWKPMNYTIHFEGNGHTGGSMTDQVVTYDTTVTLKKNQFTKKNYTFEGWNTRSDGTGTSYKDQQQIKNLTSGGSTITLYAQWKPMKYTIHFEGNGNTGGSMKDQIMTIDKAEKLNKNQFTRKDSDFTKWNTRADGKGTSYTDQQTVKNLADGNETITLYAQWDDKPVLKTRPGGYVVGETVTIDQIISENSSATDREDGNISHKVIITQIRYNKTGQVVKNPTTFDTSVGQDCDVTYQVTDSYGHTVTKVDKITLLEPSYPDSGDDGEDPLIYSRFISKGYENTLESNSKWRLNSSYRSTLNNALNKAQQMWEAQLRD